MKQIPRVVYSHLPAIFSFLFFFLFLLFFFYFFFFFSFFFHSFLFFIFILFSFVIFSFLYLFSFNIIVKLANPGENWYLSMRKGSGELARKNLIPSANLNGCKNDNFQLKYIYFFFLLKT